MTKAIHKRVLTARFLQTLKPQRHGFLIWDAEQGGLALSVRPSGHMSWKAIYNHHGRTRWYTIGSTEKIGLADARKLAKTIMAQAALGEDPQAKKKEEAGRKSFTFEALAARYVEEVAKKNNRSWKQSAYLIREHLIPRWKGKDVKAVTRDDVKALMKAIQAPVVANQALAAASAIFSWAIDEEIGGVKENPCRRMPRNETKSRERVLTGSESFRSDSEIARFWRTFDDAGLIAGTALKIILLTGQRPGEVVHMRREHIIDGWWEMPGEPKPEVGWPGTKNGESHRVWLSAPVQELLAALEDDRDTGFVFGVSRLDTAMRQICAELGVKEKVTPHDLRRTFTTRAAEMEIGEDTIDRLLNHKKRGIIKTYNIYSYANQNKRAWEQIAARIMWLATGTGDSKVIPLRA